MLKKQPKNETPATAVCYGRRFPFAPGLGIIQVKIPKGSEFPGSGEMLSVARVSQMDADEGVASCAAFLRMFTSIGASRHALIFAF